jgi:hypothetical protein
MDMTISIKRSADVRQLAHNAAQRPVYLQQHFTERLQREVVHNAEHVRHTNKSEDRTNDHGKSEKDSSNKENKDKEKKKAALSEFMGGSLIDIRV